MSLGRYEQAIQRIARTGVSQLLPSGRSDGASWLFGAASGRSYSDNSSVLHRYVLAHRPGIEAIWTIDSNSPDREIVERLGRVVPRDSLDAHRLARQADVIVFSHGIHDVPGQLCNRRALRVRLGHGLTAFGARKDTSSWRSRRHTAAIDIAPVASRMEQDHKAKWGFSREQLPITGLPRWDELVRQRDSSRTDRGRPLVLYAPTSRPWHTSGDASSGGEMAPMAEFLRSHRLREMLDVGALDLVIYLHQNTRHKFGTLDWLPDGVVLASSEAEIPRLIAQSSLLISDYSSVLWDALYVDIPVIFFQFDRDAHERNRGSYIDLRSHLFGPNVDCAEDLLDVLQGAVNGDWCLSGWADERAHWQRRAFAYRDANNAERVLDVIETRAKAR